MSPELIGHRGAPRAHAENTLASFLHAIDAGADAIELDVHGTSDGAIVVHHDPTVARPDGRAQRSSARIAKLTAEELRSIAPAVPTLGEVLDAVASRATVYIEIKADNIEADVIDCVARSHARCAIHSFDHRIVRRVGTLGAKIPTGILLSSYLLDPASALTLAGARDYWLWWEFVDRAVVEAVHAVGGRVVAWTVNDASAAHALARLGVDGLCSDVAGELATEFRRADRH
jgi:glycerophosphoryl diester phosphodiesterase